MLLGNAARLCRLSMLLCQTILPKGLDHSLALLLGDDPKEDDILQDTGANLCMAVWLFLPPGPKGLEDDWRASDGIWRGSESPREPGKVLGDDKKAYGGMMA